MKRLTHGELAEAHGRADWALLWQHAMLPLKMKVRELVARGSLRREDADEDLLQEGALAALKALRTWDPLEAVLSTHVATAVHSAIINAALTRLAGAGVGSRWTVAEGNKAEAVSMEDVAVTSAEDEDQEAEPTALTYSDTGYAPEGYGSIEEELCRQAAPHVVAELLAGLKSDDAALLMAIHARQETLRAYAERTEQNYVHVFRSADKALRSVKQKAKSCVKPSKAVANWKGLRQHYQPEERYRAFWTGIGSAVMGDSVWQQKVGRVHGDWGWKPLPKDLLQGKRQRTLFGKVGEGLDTTNLSTPSSKSLPTFITVRIKRATPHDRYDGNDLAVKPREVKIEIDSDDSTSAFHAAAVAAHKAAGDYERFQRGRFR